MHHHVGHVAMHENLARQQADDLVGRHAGIGAADPQVFGVLQRGQLFEEARVHLAHLARPGQVVIEEVEQVLVLDLRLGPVIQVQCQEHRAFHPRRVVGRRLLEAQLAIQLHGNAHGRQGIEHHLVITESLRRLDRRQGQHAAHAVAADFRLHVEPLHFADTFGRLAKADTTGRLAIEFGEEQPAGRRRVGPRQGRHLFGEVLKAQVDAQPASVIPEELPDVFDFGMVIRTENAKYYCHQSTHPLRRNRPTRYPSRRCDSPIGHGLRIAQGL